MDHIQLTKEIEEKCCVARGVKGSPAPIPQEGQWTKCKEITQISGLTHGCGCCAPQQGTCKLTLNVKDGIIQEYTSINMWFFRYFFLTFIFFY